MKGCLCTGNVELPQVAFMPTLLRAFSVAQRTIGQQTNEILNLVSAQGSVHGATILGRLNVTSRPILMSAAFALSQSALERANSCVMPALAAAFRNA